MFREGAGAKVPRTVTSCRSCLAWGLTYAQGLCLACYNFTRRSPVAGPCAACAREEPLKSGYCRLCWCQASLERPSGPGTKLAPYLAEVRHHQLFFAGMNARKAAARTLPRRKGARGRPLKPPPPAAALPSLPWVQPPLPVSPVVRHYHRRIDLRSAPAPDNPHLAHALHLAHQMAEARGFGADKRRALQRVLVMLLAGHRDGDMVLASDARDLARRHYANVAHVAEIVRAAGVLADDQPSRFDTWLEAKLDGLADGIRAEVRRWARILRDGGPRTRPRRENTARSYLRSLQPGLLEWSARYDHLREVTRNDILDCLHDLTGSQRYERVAALRSLFGWAKAAGVVFRNPAARIPRGSRADKIWQPLSEAEIGQAISAATTPQARLVIALAAVHAARHGQIRALQLSDADVPNRRLTVAGHPRPLDDLTCTLLNEWLGHRRSRWPGTSNPHLLISQRSAVGLGPVSVPWVGAMLRGLPATIEQLRIDRQLDEALTSGADPLHLAAVFGMDTSTAIRYAANARQLLAGPGASGTSARPAPPRGHCPPA